MIDTVHVSIMEPDVIPPKTRIIKEWRAKQAKESDPKSTMKLLNGLRYHIFANAVVLRSNSSMAWFRLTSK